MDDDALNLWREWFTPREEGTGRHKHTVSRSPFYSTGDMDDTYCFFCHEEQYGDEEKHEPDCIYVRAKKLVAG